ncbi:MAG: glycerol-3-phosphate acyltransferase [Alphaproteobacteria bacterium]|nr:MAG: glycerol-3-phosphate acyltransferase [Alphaproteobacteria bacterium]
MDLLAHPPLYYILAYFIGAIPFGYIFTKVLTHKDIRRFGSGSVGATNALRSGSTLAGIATLACDTAKAYGCLAFLKHIGANVHEIGFSGIILIIGHCWPLWLGFKGGKGIAVFLGIIFTHDYFPYAMTLLGVIPALIIIKATRLSSLGTLTGISLSLGYGLYAQHIAFLYGGIMYALIIWQHRGNIQRLVYAEEGRI